MKDYPVSKIRNVVLLGHGRAGKTSLTEAMLFSAGASDRLGTVQAGNTVSDYDQEEVSRGCSINTSLLPLEWNGNKINIIDTPGFFDYVGEQYQGICAADSALLVMSGKSGLSVGAEKAWAVCEKRQLPVMIFINKLDDEKANFNKVLDDLQNAFGNCIVPFFIPIKEGDNLIGVVNVVEMNAVKFEGGKAMPTAIPDHMESEIAPIREMILEAVAETDDKLMDKYFAGEDFTTDEILKALKIGITNRSIIPVLCGSALKNQGTTLLLDALLNFLPSPVEAKKAVVTDKNQDILTLDCDPSKPLAAQCFKTIADPFIGKLSFIKVHQGTLKADGTVFNPNTNAEERIGAIYLLRGKKQTPMDKISAGDIGVVPKLSGTTTGHTLCDKQNYVLFEQIEFPKPAAALAIKPKTKGDEEKINSGLQKLKDEDPTLLTELNTETNEQIIKGIGEQHIEVVVSKLKSKYGVSVDLAVPKIAYRETIRKSVKVEGKHKKQSGGHGQFGHVWVEFEPTDSDGLVFEEKVFGGAVPRNFFPAVEKGIRESMERGVLAGFPVVGLKATLYDGSYHSVDSSEMSFKMAAALAYKAGLPQAGPVLLEPIGTLVVNIPDSFMGDLMGDINKRRGRVLGSEPESDQTVTITAEVPMGEMAHFVTDLRSITQGRGSFSFEFKAYEQAPEHIAKKVMEENQKDAG